MDKLNIEEILGSFKGLKIEDVLNGHIEAYEDLKKQEQELKGKIEETRDVIIDGLNGMNVDSFETSDRIVSQYTRKGQKFNKAKCFDDLYNKNKIPSHYLNKHQNKTISETLCLRITKK
tara:strand:+ start:245 stop:601 length:357 start_codon:yes stop_codon:yes gene_type:complete